MPLEDILEQGRFGLLPVAFENPIQEQHSALILQQENIVIGINSKYAIFRENFDEVNIFALKEKYIYSQTQVIFDECESNITWRVKMLSTMLVR